MEDEKFGEIAVEEDTDGKAVWTFEGKIKTDVPLDTDAQDVAGAINELAGKLQDEGGGDDWQPPEWWITVPEPQAYEIYLLVDILDTSGNYEEMTVVVSRPVDANTGHGALFVDWGDGSSRTYGEGEWSRLFHKYTDTGQYLIKVTVTEQSCFLQELGGFNSLLIAKLGSGIIINNVEASGGNTYYTQAAFYNKPRLCMVKINGDGVLPVSRAFYNCYALKKVEMINPPIVIGANSFVECYSLTKFDFSQVVRIENIAVQKSGFKSIALPKCTYIGQGGLQNNYSLQSVEAPICTSIGGGAFESCYALEKAVFADDCVFGSACFSSCYSLYPRPDGSIR